MVNNPDYLIQPGDLYEDGFFHPCICFWVDDAGFACGVSLIDGSFPRSTDIQVGGIRKLTMEEAWKMKLEWRDE